MQGGLFLERGRGAGGAEAGRAVESGHRGAQVLE